MYSKAARCQRISDGNVPSLEISQYRDISQLYQVQKWGPETLHFYEEFASWTGAMSNVLATS